MHSSNTNNSELEVFINDIKSQEFSNIEGI